MEDSSEDLPKPPRRSAARPFFSPRPEGATGPLELSRRRAAQLFTPPGSTPATPSPAAADAPVSSEPAKEGETSAPASAENTQVGMRPAERYQESAADDAEDWTLPATRATEDSLDAASLLEQPATVDDDENHLFVEQYETEEIELTAGSGTREPDEHSIEVIEYDDANSLLRAAANEGERPRVDGIRLETTEFSFHESANEEPQNAETFWASEPFGAASAAPSESASTDGVTAEERETEHAEMALDDAETSAPADDHPLEWGTVDTMRADPAPRRADVKPPWVGRPTPASTASLEELKESEPWTVSPASPDAAPVLDDEDAEAPAADVVALEDRYTQERAIPMPPAHPVAAVLERLAARVRSGDLHVPPGAETNDAAALAAVLTALLRQSH